jgi:hypothetical protein
MMIRPTGGQPPAGLSAAWELAHLRANLVFLVTIIYQHGLADHGTCLGENAEGMVTHVVPCQSVF